MLYNTVELIIQASSNFHFIFCFCNLIIIFVLIAESSKLRSNRSLIHTKTVYPSSFRADYNGVMSNASSIKGSTDDHDAENDQHFSDKPQLNVCQIVDDSEEQEDSTETGYLEIQIYDEFSPENEEVNLSFEEELRNPEEVDDDDNDDDDDDDDDDDGDELKRKIDEFIAKEKLRINYELVIN